MGIASLSQQDDVAPATPSGGYCIATARAEGAGFPAVAAGDAVAQQSTIAGVGLRGISSPSGDRYADVDAHDDVAPATPRGLYPLALATTPGALGAVAAGDATVVRASLQGIAFSSIADSAGARAASVETEDAVASADPTGIWGNLLTARAENAGFPAVAAGDVVTPQGTVAGLPLQGLASPTGDRFLDVDAEDDVSPADPRGLYTLVVAQAEGGAGPGVVAGDAVVPRGSTGGVPYLAITDGATSRVADVDAENEPAPAAPRGLYAGGRTTAASPAFADGDYTPLNFDLSGQLRVTGVLATGTTAVHVDFTTGAALPAGASDQTFRTVAAGGDERMTSCAVRYTGTVVGVTLQMKLGGVLVDLPIGSLASAVWNRILEPGITLYGNTAETFQISLTGATLNDTLDVRAHFERYLT